MSGTGISAIAGAIAVEGGGTVPAPTFPQGNNNNGGEEGDPSLWEYSDTEGGVVITQYKGTETTVTIPSQIDGKPVVVITGYTPDRENFIGVFDGTVTSVTIPDSVTDIGDAVFQGCSGLTSIDISAGVKGIGTRAFMYCTGLTSITIPDSVTTIGDNAFNGCTALTSVTFEGACPHMRILNEQNDVK